MNKILKKCERYRDKKHFRKYLILILKLNFYDKL